MSDLRTRADARERPGGASALTAAPSAFDDVVRQYRRPVTVTAYRITGNIDDARDVAQHVFMQMYLKGPLFEDQRSLDRWLYVVTRNEALNVRRRRQRDVAAAAAVHDDAPQLGLEETVLQNERAEKVREMIALLSAADRQLIEQRHFQSIPSTEIARSLGLPVGRVNRVVERARSRLRMAILRRGLDAEMR